MFIWSNDYLNDYGIEIYSDHLILISFLNPQRNKRPLRCFERFIGCDPRPSTQTWFATWAAVRTRAGVVFLHLSIYIHTCIYIYTHVYTYIYTCIYIHVHIYVCWCINIWVGGTIWSIEDIAIFGSDFDLSSVTRVCARLQWVKQGAKECVLQVAKRSWAVIMNTNGNVVLQMLQSLLMCYTILQLTCFWRFFQEEMITFSAFDARFCAVWHPRCIRACLYTKWEYSCTYVYVCVYK